MELTCYLFNDNGNKYGIFNKNMSIKGEFVLSILEDFLNMYCDHTIDTLWDIDIPNDGSDHKYLIELDLVEDIDEDGIHYDCYDIRGYKKLDT
jgi:hypothetical protein